MPESLQHSLKHENISDNGVFSLGALACIALLTLCIDTSHDSAWPPSALCLALCCTGAAVSAVVIGLERRFSPFAPALTARSHAVLSHRSLTCIQLVTGITPSLCYNLAVSLYLLALAVSLAVRTGAGLLDTRYPSRYGGPLTSLLLACSPVIVMLPGFTCVALQLCKQLSHLDAPGLCAAKPQLLTRLASISALVTDAAFLQRKTATQEVAAAVRAHICVLLTDCDESSIAQQTATSAGFIDESNTAQKGEIPPQQPPTSAGSAAQSMVRPEQL